MKDKIFDIIATARTGDKAVNSASNEILKIAKQIAKNGFIEGYRMNSVNCGRVYDKVSKLFAEKLFEEWYFKQNQNS